jgi:peptidoglycan/xylan/chitin deacetylase (PgdA/CDA1 family)
MLRPLLLLAALATAVSVSAAPPRQVAFTFDDLPGVNAACDLKQVEEMNRRLIAAIRRAEMPATALVVESNLCPPLRRNIGRIYEMWLTAGLDLGNHTHSHHDLNVTPLKKYQKDVIDGERTLRPLLASRGKKLRYFRYPYLRSGTDLEKKRAFEQFLERRGYINAPVTIDNDEWIYAVAYGAALRRGDKRTATQLADDYVRYMNDMFGFYETLSRETLGYELPQVLLLHVNQLNADHLDRLVMMARKRGYEFISLDEALRDKAYAQRDRYVGNRGFSWLHRWAIDKGKNPPMHAEPPDWVMDLYRAR